MGKCEGVCKRAPLSACAGKAEEGAVAEPRRLTTTQSSVRDEWGAACTPSHLRILRGNGTVPVTWDSILPYACRVWFGPVLRDRPEAGALSTSVPLGAVGGDSPGPAD